MDTPQIKKNLFLVIDQGTSSTKSFLFDTQGALLLSDKIKHSLNKPAPYYVECDPLPILNACKSLIEQSQLYATKQGYNIHSMGLAVQRSTFLFWDKYSLEPRTQALSWQDSRAATLLKNFKSYRNEIVRLTGSPLSAHFGGPKFLHCIKENPSLKKDVQSGNLLFGPLSAFLTHVLTGRPNIDESIACRSLLFNIHKRKWSNKLLDLFQVPVHALPELIPTEHNFGIATPGNLPLNCVIGDQQAALIGQTGKVSGSIAMNFGTSGSIQFNTGTKATVLPGLISSILSSSMTHKMYIVEGTINACNSLFYHLEKELNISHKDMQWNKRCEGRKTNGVFVPGFLGIAAPYWTTGFSDIYEKIDISDQNDIIRAGMESIGFLVNDILDKIKPTVPSFPNNLNASGGGAKPPLLQFIADLTNLQVNHSKMKDRTAFGVFKILNSKENRNLTLKQSFVDSTFNPNMSDVKRKKKIKLWHSTLNSAEIIA